MGKVANSVAARDLATLKVLHDYIVDGGALPADTTWQLIAIGIQPWDIAACASSCTPSCVAPILWA